MASAVQTEVTNVYNNEPRQIKHFRYVGFVRSASHGRATNFGRNIDGYNSEYTIMRQVMRDENLDGLVEAFLINSDGKIVEWYPSEVPPMNLIPCERPVDIHDFSVYKRKK